METLNVGCRLIAASDPVRGAAIPILLWTAELDEITPPHHGRAIAAALPRTTPLDHRVIAGGGHFAVQDPFPPAMVSHDFAPALDPRIKRHAPHHGLRWRLARLRRCPLQQRRRSVVGTFDNGVLGIFGNCVFGTFDNCER